MPDNFTPNPADLGIRSASLLRSELSESVKALTSQPAPTPPNPQIDDFTKRLSQEVNQGIVEAGAALLNRVDKTLGELLGLTQLTGVVLASISKPINPGQSDHGTFVLSNLGKNPMTNLELIASDLKTVSGPAAVVPAANVTITPNPVTISPRSSATLTVSVAVPAGQVQGFYYGSIVDAANGMVRGLISIEVKAHP